MDTKKEVIHNLEKARQRVSHLISLMENGYDCLQVHDEINKAIHSIEVAKKELLNQHLNKSLIRLLKNNVQGNKTRKEVINLFKT